MRIDSHHHFWKYTQAEYAWIGEGMERLQEDFLPSDLEAEIDDVDIEGVVSVQARETVEETHFLLEFARRRDFIKGVVGWIPFTSPEVGRVLEELAGEPKLRGVRHVIQNEKYDYFILRPDFNQGISRLKEHGLVYDILIFERQLPQTIQFVDLHPNQPFVLDHMAKPLIAKGELEPWATRMRELAKRENVTCKVSGMVTEAEWGRWSTDELKPYFDVVLEAFGPGRLMFGSDWPVCLVSTEYKKWVETAEDLADGFSEDEFKAFFGGTAGRVYGLK
jgi:L-fuconolactonase